MKTHPCDLLTMTAEQAWENTGKALRRAYAMPKGYHRNHWLELAKRSADVWFDRTENRLAGKERADAIQRDDLDRTARGKVR